MLVRPYFSFAELTETHFSLNRRLASRNPYPYAMPFLSNFFVQNNKILEGMGF